MGNLLSVATPLAAQSQADTKAVVGKGGDASAPLFLNDVKAEPASWSQEGLCLTFQRFFGMLPDSAAEALKQEQRNPQFHCRPSTFGLNVQMRADAIIVVQRVFRRYRLLTKWHDVAGQLLELARSRIETRKSMEEEEMTLANFRTLLAQGFSAHKVSITGSLKNIQLQLVMNQQAEECYLTWTPSRKRQPRIHLHDVEQVIPVIRTGNKHAPRLASKVSHRRGLIIVCKSHHRGRVVLEMASKRERNLLLCGFQRLLEDMNRVAPTLDASGAIRKRLPRRQSALEFFDPLPNNGSDAAQPAGNATPQRRLTKTMSAPAVPFEGSPATSPSSSSAKRDSATLKQLYQTRFDLPEQPEQSAPKTTLLRRSSMVATPVLH